MNPEVMERKYDVLRDQQSEKRSLLLAEDSTTTGAAARTELPSLQKSEPAAADTRDVGDHTSIWNITPCPKFERLRPSAWNDRFGNRSQRRPEAKQVEELQRQREAFSESVTMDDYYATLFWPSFQLGPVPPSAAKNCSSTSLPRVPQLRVRSVLEDVEKSFITCYYKMNPEALKRIEDAKALEENWRQSAHSSAPIPVLDEGGADLKTATLQQGKSTRVRKRRVPSVPQEGAPVANLALLSASLAVAADRKGLITREAFMETLSKAPFEVRDKVALDSFFLLVRSLSTVKEGVDGETERRLEISCSNYGSVTRSGLQRSAPRRVSSAHHTGSHMTVVPTSPTMNVSSVAVTGRRVMSAAGGGGGNQSILRPLGPTPRPSRSGITPRMSISLADSASYSHVRVREVVAAVDALINGPALRDVVRSICFRVLETDGFIHKEALRRLRVSCRESCETKDAIVTPSIVKALGDALELMLQEEEQAYIRAQMKLKRQKKGNKLPTLLSNQKTLVPLHMMRRSHISAKEFCRFFDEMPFFVAAFAHIWLPAFFATSWPPGQRSPGHRFSMNDTLTSEEEDKGSSIVCTTEGSKFRSKALEWEKVVVAPLAAVLSDPVQRRNVGQHLVRDRLEYMKLVPVFDSDIL